MKALSQRNNTNANKTRIVSNQKLSETIPAIIVSKNATKTQSTHIEQTIA